MMFPRPVVLLISFSLVLLMIPPTMAEDISLNRWAENITIEKDGTVDAIIQVEINNGGQSPIEGISFTIPASQITMIYDFYHTFSFNGMIVNQESVPGGTKIIINFNNSVAPGSKWDGRLGFVGKGWAIRKDQTYSIVIPFNAPDILTSSGKTTPGVSEDSDLRVQVFLPESVDATLVTPKPFKILFQSMHRVPTWNSASIKMRDVVRIEASYSEVLAKIVSAEKKRKEVLDQVNKAKAGGRNVSEAEEHLTNAENYILQQALGKYNTQEYSISEEYLTYANQEISQAENVLGAPQIPKANTPLPTGPQKIPMLDPATLISALLLAFFISKIKK